MLLSGRGNLIIWRCVFKKKKNHPISSNSHHSATAKYHYVIIDDISVIRHGPFDILGGGELGIFFRVKKFFSDDFGARLFFSPALWAGLFFFITKCDNIRGLFDKFVDNLHKPKTSQ